RDIDSCTFINNYSTLYGGGFYFDDSDKINNIDIHDSRFDNNTSITIGSAIYCSIGKTNGSMALIRSSSFLSNSPKGGSVIYFTSSGFNIVKK
ncbi:MAG: hypothetical protein L6Q97_21140, partial [Thermoanaerobaculia bacterium]|nr:hypothetical protein [Thermoanaerobaculia bacterium]